MGIIGSPHGVFHYTASHRFKPHGRQYAALRWGFKQKSHGSQDFKQNVNKHLNPRDVFVQDVQLQQQRTLTSDLYTERSKELSPRNHCRIRFI